MPPALSLAVQRLVKACAFKVDEGAALPFLDLCGCLSQMGVEIEGQRARDSS